MRQSVKLSFLAALSLTFISNFIAIPANVNLFVTSFLTIYVGSHRRLVQMEVRLFFIAKRRFFGRNLTESIYRILHFLPNHSLNKYLRTMRTCFPCTVL